jgi:phage/plasmid-like protein (TIGR03299 family)
MPHELDNTQGVYSYADSRSDAWHQLGQQVEHLMDAQEVLAAAYLSGWNVHKRPIFVAQDPVLTETGVTTPPPVRVPDMYATVRTNPITGDLEPLGVVGERYEPVANESSCTILNALTDEAGAVYQTAGALRGGRETFVTMKLPESMTFEGRNGADDRTEWYLAAVNSHDGQSRFRLLLTPIRIVCANTQSAAIAQARSTFGVTHTSSAGTAIQHARAALRLSWRYIAEFKQEAAALYAAPMDVGEMQAFTRRLCKVEQADSDAARKGRDAQAAAIVKLWVSSPTVAPILGQTRWAAYNAVTEWADHFAPVRGVKGARAVAQARALRAVTNGSSAHTLKVEAFKLLQTL